MNKYWDELQTTRAKEKRRDVFKIFACIAVLALILGAVAFKVASGHLAQVGTATSQTEASRLTVEADPQDGRVLLIGIVVLAVLSALGALVLSGSFTRMLTTLLIVGALNFIVGQVLWNSNAPDPTDCLRFSLEFCGVLAVMDIILLAIMAAFGWAAKKDAGS